MVLALVAAALAGSLAAAAPGPVDRSEGGSGAAAADTCRPAEAALLVRGLSMFEHQELREGLDVLARVREARPDWPPALSAYAGALLRGGRFAEAADAYAELVGRDAALELADGRLAPGDLAPGVEPDHVLGLAVAKQNLGDERAADRLFRAYADLVGPTSPRAARAYWRLSEMFSESPVPWGDAEAERAKALAVDPAIQTRLTLPDLPDLRSIAETEPYTREVTRAVDRSAPGDEPSSLPVLIDWSEPVFEDAPGDTGWGRETIDVLVGEDGRPEKVALPQALDPDSGVGASLIRAAMSWCFEPARGESGAVAAWVSLGVDAPRAEAAGDTTAPAGEGAPDAGPGRGEGEPGQPGKPPPGGKGPRPGR
jgi:tetratricopeptide (TPR) repeat protein